MSIALSSGSVKAHGYELLSRVSGEVDAEADPNGHGLFLSARSKSSSSRLVFDLGCVPELKRFTVCHRYEPYWMKPRTGTRLADVPQETQFFLAELRSGQWLVLVPLIGDLFRFSLRGHKDDRLELLAETGDSFAPGNGGLALFVATGSDPFALARDGAKSVAERLRWGRLRRDKTLPDFVGHFGWCTWDAFYQEVSHAKVREGLERFAAGGVRPRMVILDDGWQSTVAMATGEQRLTAFSANDKFGGSGGQLAPTVRMAKEEFGVEDFLVWHAVIGYWGGVDGERLPGYGVIDQTRQFGEGVLSHAPSFNQIWWGNVVGFVPAAHVRRFYEDYHASLAAQGVDGVKVDSQAVLESVAQRQGGRIAVSRAYREALEESVQKHFDGRLINCMSNGQETWYGSLRSSLLRSSIDFFPTMPETHGMHLYTNAQVGLWFGQFMHPDWDMFQSGHEWGAFHAAGRAISGGPVYVSDKPGEHDFALLKKLVCSDGSVLLCDAPALPTIDCLCVDPTHEDVLLKIWNRSGAAGVVGVFNARFSPKGAGPVVITGTVGPADVPGLTQASYACYAHHARSLEILSHDARLALTLGERDFEIVTFVPVDRGFAPIGLTDKLNSAGAVSEVTRHERHCDLALRDGGDFLAWAEAPPAAVEIDGRPAVFGYDAQAKSLRVTLGAMGRQALRIRW
jgi:raffinose synthase